MNNRLVPTIVILVLVLVGIIWFLMARGLVPTLSFNNTNSTKPSDWQAVFLANGQVYFGKLADENKQLVKLTDVYYLQVSQTNPDKKDEQPQVSLVKLGNELHGPVDEMHINRDHIYFTEQMKNDAKVVEAIERYKKEGPSSQNLTSPEPSASPTK